MARCSHGLSRWCGDRCLGCEEEKEIERGLRDIARRLHAAVCHEDGCRHYVRAGNEVACFYLAVRDEGKVMACPAFSVCPLPEVAKIRETL